MRRLKETLEFDLLLEEISKFSLSEAGRRGCLELKPLRDINEVKDELERLKEVDSIIEDIPLFSGLDWIPDFLVSDVLEPGHLLKISKLLEYTEELLEYLKKRDVLQFLRVALIPLPDLKNEIINCIDDEGGIKEDATPELKRLFNESRKLEGKIKQVVERFLVEHGDVLQEKIITQRSGRNVVPVKKGFVSGIDGVVVDISRSGETAFVEPMEAVYLNNKLAETRIEIEREKHRILIHLTSIVKSHRKEILSNFHTVLYLDTIVARLRFMRKYGGILPEIREKRVAFSLRKISHPLLVLKGFAVPQDISLGEDFKTLVVSGPNAGGKTVLLKTIGIAILSFFHGIPILAEEGSYIGNIKNLFAVIEDEQSIEEGLSSFTSHLIRLKEVLNNAGEGDVVLVDEIGGGTDPVEGSALAMAVLEELLRRGCLTIATTHLSGLKFFVQNIEGMVNGAMEFKDGPTYRLIVGLPGVSMAIETAKLVGIPTEILDRAEEYMNKEELQVNKLLSEYHSRLSTIKELEGKLIEREKEIERIKSEYEARLKDVKKERKELLKRAKQEAEEIVKEARSLVERTIKEIREKNASRESIKKYKEDFESALERLKEEEVAQTAPEVEDKHEITIQRIEPLEKLDIDVRGLYRDDAVEQVDRFIDRAYLHGISTVYVIHGKGGGVLRSAIRDFLSHDKRVKNFYSAPPEEGGSGVTIVEIK